MAVPATAAVRLGLMPDPTFGDAKFGAFALG